MIFERVNAIECLMLTSLKKQTDRLKALETVKELLDEVDHEVEEIPLTDKERLIGLFTSLKGLPLNQTESEVVTQIITFNTHPEPDI